MNATVTCLPSGADPILALTTREREIVALMARGWSNRRICSELFLSEKTLESHVRSIFLKLGLARDDRHAHRRVVAVLMYLSSPAQHPSRVAA